MEKSKKEINHLLKRIERVKERLKKAIIALPDNSNIERLGDSGAFTVNMSEVFKTPGTILSPDYYDFKCQYLALCSLIDKVEPHKVFPKLEDICKTGKHDFAGYGIHGRTTSVHNTLKFHPDVIKSLESLLKKV